MVISGTHRLGRRMRRGHLNKMLVIELNNGRTAQMGILALMVHEKLNNNPHIINPLLGFPVPC